MKNLKLALIFGLILGSFNVFAETKAGGEVDPNCEDILAQARDTSGKPMDNSTSTPVQESGGGSTRDAVTTPSTTSP